MLISVGKNTESRTSLETAPRAQEPRESWNYKGTTLVTHWHQCNEIAPQTEPQCQINVRWIATGLLLSGRYTSHSGTSESWCQHCPASAPDTAFAIIAPVMTGSTPPNARRYCQWASLGEQLASHSTIGALARRFHIRFRAAAKIAEYSALLYTINGAGARGPGGWDSDRSCGSISGCRGLKLRVRVVLLRNHASGDECIPLT